MPCTGCWVSIPSVGTTMALCVADRSATCRRAAAAVASVQRGGAVRLQIVQGTCQTRGVLRERVPVVQGRVEREHSHLVLTRPELREDRVEGLPGHRQLRADRHAAAHVHEDRQAHRGTGVGAERQHGSELTVVADLEVRGSQAGDRPGHGHSEPQPVWGTTSAELRNRGVGSSPAGCCAESVRLQLNPRNDSTREDRTTNDFMALLRSIGRS